jgi:hypothetical protein
MGLGVGRLAYDVNGRFGDIHPTSGNVQGFGTAIELSVGGTPLPGFVVGAAIYGENVTSPSSSNMAIAGAEYDNNETFDGATLGSLGLFADWYVDPHAGWHIQTAIAPSAGFDVGSGQHIAYITQGAYRSSSNGMPRHFSHGPSAALGAGWEGWIGEQWGLGVLLRVTYAHVTSDDVGGPWTHDVFALPSLLGTATFH